MILLIKILLFATRFYPAISGGDFYIERLGREFKKKSLGLNKTFIITTNAIDFNALHSDGKKIEINHPYYSKYKDLEIKRFSTIMFDKNNLEKNKEILRFREICKDMLDLSYEDLKPFIKNGPMLPELNNFLEFKNDIHEISSFEPDIIHCSYLPYTTLLYALLIGKKIKIPAMVTPFLHNNNARYIHNSIFIILNKFDKIFACTNAEKKEMISHGIKSSKILILPMGVDFQKFEKNHIDIIKKNFSINHPLVLFCGYKNFEKGALTILNSIPFLMRKNKIYSFIFIGPSTIAFNLSQKKIKKKYPEVEIYNLSPDNLSGIFDKKKIGAFQLADIFCMPSRSDAYGIVYLEAWASKTPVIAAKFEAMKEVVDEGIDGELVEFDNPKKLSKLLIKMMKNPNKLKIMGKSGNSKITKHNSWFEIAKATLISYKKFL